MNKTLTTLCAALATAFAGASFAQSGSASSGDGAVPASRSSAQDGNTAPTTGSSTSSSSTVPSAKDAPGYVASTLPEDQPRSRAEVQAEGTAAMHNGEVARGEALATWDRPHGGPINGDATSTGAGAGHTNGRLQRNLAH